MNTITRLLVYGIITMSLTALPAQVRQDSTKVENSTNDARQDYISDQIQKLIELKAKVEEQEKQYLKQDIEASNKRLDNKEISAEEAENLKKEAATKPAVVLVAGVRVSSRVSNSFSLRDPRRGLLIGLLFKTRE